MPLLKVVLGLIAIALGPFFFGFLCPSVTILTWWGLCCELIAWIAILVEVHKVDKLFSRRGFLQRLLEAPTEEQPAVVPFEIRLPFSFRAKRLKLTQSGSFEDDPLKQELKALEEHFRRLLDQLHRAHSEAIHSVDTHLSLRLSQVETRLRDAVTGDLGWAYFFAILAAGGLVLSTVPDRIVALF